MCPCCSRGHGGCESTKDVQANRIRLDSAKGLPPRWMRWTPARMASCHSPGPRHGGLVGEWCARRGGLRQRRAGRAHRLATAGRGVLCHAPRRRSRGTASSCPGRACGRPTWCAPTRRSTRTCCRCGAGSFDRRVTGRLVLITCTGTFDPRTRHYDHNLVVSADPSGWPCRDARAIRACRRPLATHDEGPPRERGGPVVVLAEDRGFEPLRAFTQHAFQACALGHYANPPPRRLPERAACPEIAGFSPGAARPRASTGFADMLAPRLH